MGHPDHLAKLRQGPVSWNAWRAENPGLSPDLSNVVLSAGETLLGPVQGGPFDLRDTLLNRANLDNAVLAGATLENADLRGANLSCASLVSADLSFANLTGAVLHHADFQDARLIGTIFDGARLELAVNLTQAQIEDAHGDESTTLPPPLTAPEAWVRAPDLFGFDDRPHQHDEPADPYVVLGLTRKAKPDEIRASYIRLAKRYHPDMNLGDLESERQFKRISEAYRLLTALETRRGQRRRQPRSSTPWAGAMGLCLIALAAPAAAVYWFDLAPFLADAAPVQKLETGSVAKLEPQMAALLELQRVSREAPAHTASPPGETERAEDAAPARTPKVEATLPQENLSERLETASNIIAASASADADPELDLAAAEAAPARSEPAAQPDAEPKPTGQVAALAEGSPEQPAEDAPWDQEWRLLRQSTELLALQSFIARHPQQPVAEEARKRFRMLVAGTESADELKSFIEKADPDSPERVLANGQLALLVEKQASEADEQAWTATAEAGTVAAYRAYLTSYPGGRHAGAAEERLAALEAEIAGRRKDVAAWTKARKLAKPAAYRAYIKAYPDGAYVEDAKRQLAALGAREESRRTEDDAWTRAKKENTRKSYFAYLNAYPKGRYATQAQRSIDSFGRPSATGATAPAAAPPRQRQSQGGPTGWPSSNSPFIDGMPGSN